ncbi:MAG TPA: diaminobutyrate acetyltransferase [Oligoflexia bacterium]|nr:diaminobutyrate acetyltransferase [Oligoflexia bacterium]HMR25083.1 diaminobutyrate acetyltransferase [Oligoflexia bacterium]
MKNFIFRKPKKSDAQEIHAMLQPYKPYVGTSPVYTYLLICEHFDDTSIVVTSESDEIVGFISAYQPPKKQNTLFLWEVAVKKGYHGNNLNKKMIEKLFNRINPNYIEATVNPSNQTFIKRLKQLSKNFACELSQKVLFASDHFGTQNHEDEVLFRMGPIQKNASSI